VPEFPELTCQKYSRFIRVSVVVTFDRSRQFQFRFKPLLPAVSDACTRGTTEDRGRGFLVWLPVLLIARWLAGLVIKRGGYRISVVSVLGIWGGILGGSLAKLGIWSGGMIGPIMAVFPGAAILVDECAARKGARAY
jgi:hypothetical protein